jgi:hypothetical protein
MSGMLARGLLACLRSPWTPLAAGAALFLEVAPAVTIHGCTAAPSVYISQGPDGLVAEEDGAGPAVGRAYCPEWLKPRDSLYWPPVSRHFSPQIWYSRFDGVAPTPAELAEVRAICVDQVARVWKDPALAAVLRADAGPVDQVFPGAYAVRALALSPLLVATLWLGVGIRDRRDADRRDLRLERGQCAACGYRRAGLPAGAPCPECGARPEPAAASQ